MSAKAVELRFYRLVNLLKVLNYSVLVHLLVNVTEELGLLCRLPALLVLASVDFEHGWHVLPEIQPFAWMNLSANCILKVLIRNHTIIVLVKHFKELLILFISEFEAPMVQVKLQFILHDSPILVFTYVMKRFPNRLPLELNLIQNVLCERSWVH